MEKILRQGAWLFFTQGITRTIGFFYTIFLARNLVVSDFGLYTAALAYFYLISSIVDFGFNRFLIREIAQNRSKITELFSSISLLRLTFSSLIFACFAITLYFFDPDKLRVYLSLLVILAILPQSLGQTIEGVFIALRKLQFSAIVLLVTSIITAISGIILVTSGFGPSGAAIALVLGQFVYALFLLYLLRKQNIKFLSEVTIPIFKKVIFGSLPYGVLIVLGLIYFRVDVLLLSYLKGSFDTGIYGVAYRFLEAALIIPIALSTALFPVFSKVANINEVKVTDEKTYKLYKRSVLILVILSFFVLAMYYVLLPSFIKIFLPNYSLSIDVIKILTLSIPFFFISSLQATFLMSQEKLLNHLTKVSIFMIVFILILNLFLIPKYSFIGAAWVTVISEFILVLIFSVLIKKYLR